MLNQLFDDRTLIRLLARKRAGIADQRSKEESERRMCRERKPAGLKALPDPPDPVCAMLPPRRVWARYRVRHRQGKDPLWLNAKAIERAALDRLANPGKDDAVWIEPFNAFANNLRDRALNAPDFRFHKPRISPIPKGKDGNHRAIAIYHPEDGIISTLLTRYLRSRFDDQLSDSSYAFREPGDGACKSHHDAMEDILAFRGKYPEGSLWVAECDIRGFFDCLHHACVRNAFSRFSSNAARAGKPVDPRAKLIFDAYLESYSFTRNVIAEALPRLKAAHPHARIDWHPDALREYYPDPLDEPIGIPQGGAISSLIANLVLHQVDMACLPWKSPDRARMIYARYCDDMILVSPDRRLLEKCFNRYIRALTSLRLPVHNPVAVGRYDKGFWKIKSRHPYNWRHNPAAPGSSPWIGFVGYQIRCDGLVRIRLESVRRHHEKLIGIADKALQTLFEKSADGARVPRPGVLVTGPQALFRLKCRMISSGVGRPQINGGTRSPAGQRCWIGGFKALIGKVVDMCQMRRLDRQRGSQLARVARAVSRLPKMSHWKSVKPKVRYQGAPFSYYEQVRKKPELRPDDNPPPCPTEQVLKKAHWP